jgi:biopolymer transport protein ExbD
VNLRKHLRDQGDEPHVSALNDILFILLFFFLIVSTLANPNVIRLSVPKAKSDTKAKQTVVVSIDSMQHFYVDAHLTLSDSLSPALARAMSKSKRDTTAATVVINADKKAQAESIVAVMRAARIQNLRTVLAVEKEK